VSELTIAERVVRHPAPDRRIVHILSPQREYVPGDWAPIKCSDTEGIVLPGPPSRSDNVTCPDCRALSSRT
jgi:hypothetical protein